MYRISLTIWVMKVWINEWVRTEKNTNDDDDESDEWNQWNVYESAR